MSNQVLMILMRRVMDDMLRIISGSLKGRSLKTLNGNNTRPTADRVKESLFNIIHSRLPGSTVLDLFAGTGNLGLEAISRGSNIAVFVEKDRKALAVLRDNCKALGCTENTVVMPMDVLRAIKCLQDKGFVFDIVFMDPPYDRDFELPVIMALSESRIVRGDGIIIVEHMTTDDQPDTAGDFTRFDTRRYGNTSISFYRKEQSNESSSVPGEL